MKSPLWRGHWVGVCTALVLWAIPIHSEAQEICGAFETTLVAGQHIDAGIVVISHDQETLTVAFHADGWAITESHVHVADSLEGIPQNRGGNPKVGHFEYSHEHRTPVTSDVYTISLADHGWTVTGDDCVDQGIVVAAHAVVVQDRVYEVRHRDDDDKSDDDSSDDESSDDDDEESAWAAGEPFPGRNWAMYVPYELVCCCEADCAAISQAVWLTCDDYRPEDVVCDELAFLAYDFCLGMMCAEPPEDVFEACEPWDLGQACFELTEGDYPLCLDLYDTYRSSCIEAFFDDPYEPNDDFGTAWPLEGIPTQSAACIGDEGDIDTFSFALPTDADVFVSANAVDEWPPIHVELWADTGEPWLIAAGEYGVEGFELPPGLYYVRFWAEEPACYELWIDAYALPIYELEPNDTFETATPVPFVGYQMEVDACIEPEGDVDFYEVILPRDSWLGLWWRAETDLEVALFSDGPEPELIAEGEWEEMPLRAGTYYLMVMAEWPGCYQLYFWAEPMQPPPEDVYEPNDDFETAWWLEELPAYLEACIEPADDQDVFGIYVPDGNVLIVEAWGRFATPIMLDVYDPIEYRLVASGIDWLEVSGLEGGDYFVQVTAEPADCYDLRLETIAGEVEPNDDFDTATFLPVADGLGMIRGCIEPEGDADVFRFSVDELSDVYGELRDLEYWLFDSAPEPNLIQSGYGWMGGLVLWPGDYFLVVSSEASICYSIGLYFEPIEPPEDGFEPNDDFALATGVDPGEEIYACIDPMGDVDFFTFELFEESNLFVGVESDWGSEEDAPFVALYDEAFELVAEARAQIGVGFLPPGVYYVRVSSVSFACYWLYLYAEPVPEDFFEPNDTFDLATFLEIPAWDLEACIDPMGDQDFFGFFVEANSALFIDAWSAFAMIQLELYDSDYNLVAAPEGEIDWAYLPEGVYYLRITADTRACYWFFIDTWDLPPPPEDNYEPNNDFDFATEWPVATPQACIEPPGDVDVFRFEVMTDSEMSAWTEGIFAWMPIALTLYDADHTVIAEGENWVEGGLLMPGVYYLWIESAEIGCYDFWIGVWPLPIEEAEPNDDFESANVVVPRADVYGCVEEGDVDIFVFEVAATVGLDVETFGDVWPLVMTLYDSHDDSVVAESEEGYLATIVTPGVYYLAVSAFEVGCYGFNLWTWQLPEDEFEPNDDFERSYWVDLPFYAEACLDRSEDVDIFSFFIESNQESNYTVDSFFDIEIEIEVYELAEEPLLIASGFNYLQLLDLPEGEYAVKVFAAMPTCYDIGLEARPLPEPPEDIHEPNDRPENATVLEEPFGLACIDPADDLDYFAFELPFFADLWVDIDVVYGSGPVELVLLDDAFEEIAWGTNFLEAYGLPAGSYIVQFSARDVVCYEFFGFAEPTGIEEVEPNNDFGTATPMGLVSAGSWAVGCTDDELDVDVFSFELEYSGFLSVYAEFDGVVELYDAGGALIASGEFELPRTWVPAGTHYLLLNPIGPSCYEVFFDHELTAEAPAAIYFWIDDQAGTYLPGQLQWKGSFNYDFDSNTITLDYAWGGPWVPLYDDGPAPDGHEPEGQLAGDHFWTTEVFFWASATDNITIEYGAVDETDGWIWQGPNGQVTVPAGFTGRLEAPGLVIEPFGTYDFKLVLNAYELHEDFIDLFDPMEGFAAVKGGFAAWQELPMTNIGDGIFEFVWSDNLTPHGGLFKLGDEVEWVFVLEGIEYKVSGMAATEGVYALTDEMPPPDAWVEEQVFQNDKDNTAFIVGPDPDPEYLIISELVDGQLPGGQPKWVELTNLGPEPVDLSEYSLGNYNNGNIELGGGGSFGLFGVLEPCDSFVISYSEDLPGAGTFFDVYGFDPDLYHGPYTNGDDVIVLFRGLATGDGSDATIVDIYGDIGVDGTGEPWEYMDSFATRTSEVEQATDVFELDQWWVEEPGFLELGDDLAEVDLLREMTTPGWHESWSCEVPFECVEDLEFTGQIYGPEDPESPNGGVPVTEPYPPEYDSGLGDLLSFVPPPGDVADVDIVLNDVTVTATTPEGNSQIWFYLGDGQGAIRLRIDPEALEQHPWFTIRVGQRISVRVLQLFNRRSMPEISVVDGASWLLQSEGNEVFIDDRTGGSVSIDDLARVVRVTGTLGLEGLPCGGTSTCYELDHGGSSPLLFRSPQVYINGGECITFVGPVGAFDEVARLPARNDDWLNVQYDPPVPPEPAPFATLPMTVSDYYEAKGDFTELPGEDIIDFSTADCPERAGEARGDCFTMLYNRDPDGDGFGPEWAGLFFLPKHDPAAWGSVPGVEIEPGATRISFWAWAEEPYPTLWFNGGGVGWFDGGVPPYSDRDLDGELWRVISTITLTSTPTWYTLEFEEAENHDGSRANGPYNDSVVGALGWTVPNNVAPLGNVDWVFYLDDIVWE